MRSNIYVSRFVAVLDQLDKKGKRVPGLILSHPGFGKTSTIEAFCRHRNYNLITIIPSQNAADDILGLQCRNEKTGKMERLTPSWYNQLEDVMQNGKRTMLFIDEISTCDSYIQAPLLNLIFNRSLGERELPENVFIMAAGNYSADLDGAFKMSAPLFNRFIALNLESEDFDFGEVLNGTFDKLATPEDECEYFGLNPEQAKYSFEAFKDWIAEDHEIQPSKVCEITELDDIGIVGFASTRSFSNSLKFIEEYVATYSDDMWMRVVGDTLGYSTKREGKLLRNIIEANVDRFIQQAKQDLRSIAEMCKEAMDKGLGQSILEALKERIGGADLSQISKADIKAWQKLMGAYAGNSSLEYLNNIFVKKIYSAV